MKQLLSCLKHIYEHGLVHRDIKLDNLLLDEEYNLKMIDFGFSTESVGKDHTGILRTILGSKGYSAPELL